MNQGAILSIAFPCIYFLVIAPLIYRFTKKKAPDMETVWHIAIVALGAYVMIVIMSITLMIVDPFPIDS